MVFFLLWTLAVASFALWSKKVVVHHHHVHHHHHQHHVHEHHVHQHHVHQHRHVVNDDLSPVQSQAVVAFPIEELVSFPVNVAINAPMETVTDPNYLLNTIQCLTDASALVSQPTKIDLAETLKVVVYKEVDNDFNEIDWKPEFVEGIALFYCLTCRSNGLSQVKSFHSDAPKRRHTACH